MIETINVLRNRRRLAAAVMLIVLVAISAHGAFAQDSLFDKVFSGIPSLVGGGQTAEQPARSAENALRSLQAEQIHAPTAPPPYQPQNEPSPSEMLPAEQETLPDLPGPGEELLVPMAGVGAAGDFQIRDEKGLISIAARNTPLSYIINRIAEARGLDTVVSNDIDAIISITLHEKTVEQALTAILAVANYTWVQRDGVIFITSITAASTLPAHLQGRTIEVFPLDYADAQSLSLAVQGFLSPVGQVFLSESSSTDNRQTQEVLVVEDVPEAMQRIAGFIHQMDQPPRQVLIEAHILEVELKDDREHGVNFDHMFNLMGNAVSLRTVGFASTTATPAFFAEVSGGNLETLIQMLKTTTDAKTLASPRLLVLNEQMARLQVGEQLGFRVTTTTETSTLEEVQFLNVGVVLQITPRISRDNRIVLNVRPEVSSGQVNPDTGLPEEETTELSTDVLLNDGYGVVIGGLIKEEDIVTQSKVPYLGDVWMIGKLFQRQMVTKSRNEVIVVLIPRIHPYDHCYAAYEQGNVIRAETEMFEGPLLRKDRPWLPKLPDAVSNPRILRLPPVGKRFPHPAIPVEWAGTPQPQRRYPVIGKPGPATYLRPAPPPAFPRGEQVTPAPAPGPVPPVIEPTSAAATSGVSRLPTAGPVVR